MRRKVIKQGSNSYTLTLPIEWVKESTTDVLKEVDVEEENNNLIIKSINKKSNKSEILILDLKDYHSRTIQNMLNYAYRKGYDIIELRYNTKEQLEVVKNVTRNTLLGFEVIENSNKKIIIENITEPSIDKYDAIFRKVFLIVKDEMNVLVKTLDNKKSVNFTKRKEVKQIIDDYSNFLRRIISKNKYGGLKSSYYNFTINSRISLLHHSMFYLNKYIYDNNIKGTTVEILKLLNKTNEMLNSFYEVFYKQDVIGLNQIGVQKLELTNELYILLEKSKKHDNVLLFHIGEIIRLIHLSSNSIFGQSIEEFTTQ